MTDWRVSAQTAIADLRAALSGKKTAALEHLEDAARNVEAAIDALDDDAGIDLGEQ